MALKCPQFDCRQWFCNHRFALLDKTTCACSLINVPEQFGFMDKTYTSETWRGDVDVSVCVCMCTRYFLTSVFSLAFWCGVHYYIVNLVYENGTKNECYWRNTLPCSVNHKVMPERCMDYWKNIFQLLPSNLKVFLKRNLQESF